MQASDEFTFKTSAETVRARGRMLGERCDGFFVLRAGAPQSKIETKRKRTSRQRPHASESSSMPATAKVRCLVSVDGAHRDFGSVQLDVRRARGTPARVGFETASAVSPPAPILRQDRFRHVSGQIQHTMPTRALWAFANRICSPPATSSSRLGTFVLQFNHKVASRILISPWVESIFSGSSCFPLPFPNSRESLPFPLTVCDFLAQCGAVNGMPAASEFVLIT